MTRPNPSCDFCCLHRPSLTSVRVARLGRTAWVCARHLGKTHLLTKRQRGIVTERLVRVAAGVTG